MRQAQSLPLLQLAEQEARLAATDMGGVLISPERITSDLVTPSLTPRVCHIRHTASTAMSTALGDACAYRRERHRHRRGIPGDR